jgi:predicted Zn-ribbon and HTH transcriptional regulator
MICEHCEYDWSPRVSTPKSCPRCKRRFDYIKLRQALLEGQE